MSSPRSIRASRTSGVFAVDYVLEVVHDQGSIMRPVEKSVWVAERVSGEVELAIWHGDGPGPLICFHGITAQHRAFSALARPWLRRVPRRRRPTGP